MIKLFIDFFISFMAAFSFVYIFFLNLQIKTLNRSILKLYRCNVRIIEIIDLQCDEIKHHKKQISDLKKSCEHQKEETKDEY